MPEIGLDIGHGADRFEKDGGKGVIVGGKVYEEHDFNSRLGEKIEAELKRHGVTVHKIQEPFSNDVPLEIRTDFYNRRGVDLVWSIHANASSDKNVSGLCCFYWHDHAKSKKAAELFIEEVKAAGLDTHGNGLHASTDDPPSSWTNLHICRETKMTAVLTENGFMTNSEDFKRIFLDPSYADKLAIIHTKAILRYFGMGYIKPIGVDIAMAGIYKPSNQQLKDSTAIVLNRLSDKPENAISKEWRKKLVNGELTNSDALALIYYALEKGLIQGDIKNG
jgi:N-acetylmuramoyl-L-alanine amidase